MLRNPVTLLRELPPTVRVLVAGTFINKLGSFIIPFLTIVLKREFRLSGTEPIRHSASGLPRNCVIAVSSQALTKQLR